MSKPDGSDDPFQDPGWLAYAKHARETLEPMVRDSSVAIAVSDGRIDPKMAMEMGYMVMLDKPIIALVAPGSKVPNKLAIVADEIVEGTIDDPTLNERLMAAMKRIDDRLKGDDAP